MLNGSPPPLISDLVLRSEKLTLFQVQEKMILLQGHYLYAFNLPPPHLPVLLS